jgi:hypothetical protein
MSYLKLIELHATRTTVAAALLAVVVQVLMIGTLFDQMGGGMLV